MLSGNTHMVRISMEISVQVNHLRKDSGQLLRYLISIDPMIFKVLEIVDSSSLDDCEEG
jgi:hypothetical protein